MRGPGEGEGPDEGDGGGVKTREVPEAGEAPEAQGGCEDDVGEDPRHVFNCRRREWRLMGGRSPVPKGEGPIRLRSGQARGHPAGFSRCFGAELVDHRLRGI